MEKIIIQNKNNWIPIKEFLTAIGRTMKHVYYRVNNRDWYDGFVIKRGRYGRYEYGSLEDYNKWNNLI